MSWFSREWDGVHLEGCPWEDTEDTEHSANGTHHFTRDVKLGEEYKVRSECLMAIAGDLSQHDCTCPELMIEQAIGAAENYRDAIKEGL